MKLVLPSKMTGAGNCHSVIFTTPGRASGRQPPE
jgi:hypothetical protein